MKAFKGLGFYEEKVWAAGISCQKDAGGFWNAADHPVDTCAQSLVLLIFQFQESSPFTAKEQFSSKLVVHLEGMLGVSKAD